jgi:hypothetical protein
MRTIILIIAMAAASSLFASCGKLGLYGDIYVNIGIGKGVFAGFTGIRPYSASECTSLQQQGSEPSQSYYSIYVDVPNGNGGMERVSALIGIDNGNLLKTAMLEAAIRSDLGDLYHNRNANSLASSLNNMVLVLTVKGYTEAKGSDFCPSTDPMDRIYHIASYDPKASMQPASNVWTIQ